MTNMRARSVYELLVESPELRHLASSTQPGNALPPQKYVKEIWKYLALQLLPAIAEARAKLLGSVNLHDYKLAETLALAAQIRDFGLADFIEPEASRWHQQMAQLDVFVAFCYSLQQQVEPEIEAMASLRAQLEEQNQCLAAARQKLQVLEHSLGQEHGSGSKLTDLQNEIDKAQTNISNLQHEIKHELEPKKRKLQLSIDRLHAKHTQFAAHRDLLNRVGGGTTTNELRHQIAQLYTQIQSLESAKHQHEELAEQYKLTLQVLTELHSSLTELVQLKATVGDMQLKMQALEVEKQGAVQQRKLELQAELARTVKTDELLDAQVAELTKQLEVLRRQLAEVSSIKVQEEPQDLADETLRDTQKEVDRLGDENEKLDLRVKTKKQWLQGMKALEKEGSELKNQIDYARQWIKLYLEEPTS